MSDRVHNLSDLEQRQALPLRVKLLLTKTRIRNWVNEYGATNCVVLMTFSPESLVLLHLAKSLYPKINVAFGECDEEMKPITAWMASEDEAKLDEWLEFGCNHYDNERPESSPIAFWLKEDVLQYIEEVTNDSEIQ